MPLYDYECESCGVFEVVQRMADEPLRKCPDCGAACRRVILSAPNARVEANWASENNGKGRRIGQMEDGPHDRKYYKSRSELHDDCRRKGYGWED